MKVVRDFRSTAELMGEFSLFKKHKDNNCEVFYFPGLKIKTILTPQKIRYHKKNNHKVSNFHVHIKIIC